MTKSNPLPVGVSDSQLADDFAQYFYNKVDILRKDLEPYPLYTPVPLNVPPFTASAEVDIPFVEKLIKNAKPTTCNLDPLPSSLVKTHCDIFAPVICKIINTSISTGKFHPLWKQAIVKPLLKKPQLDQNKKNYRPVSNLSFLSKLVEKAFLCRFSAHMDDHSLLPSYQSAYRAQHSTETLLVKLFNDVMHNMERKLVTPFAAIDLSAAFDTVNHNLLIEILEERFGVQGFMKKWISSYLSERSFKVSINDSYSRAIGVDFSVSQGSINGPVFFTCYSSSMNTCVTNDQSIIGYADDHSIYSTFKPGDTNSETSSMQDLTSTMAKVKMDAGSSFKDER